MSKECITKTPSLEKGRSLTVHISHSAVEQGPTGTTWAPSTMWSLKIEALLRLFVLSQSKVSRTTIVLSPRRPVRQLMLKKKSARCFAIRRRWCHGVAGEQNLDKTRRSSCQSSEMKENLVHGSPLSLWLAARVKVSGLPTQQTHSALQKLLACSLKGDSGTFPEWGRSTLAVSQRNWDAP